MRILMLAQNYPPTIGGEERMVEDLSVELVRRGHSVDVATIPEMHHKWEDYRDGVRLHALRSSVYRARRLHGGGDRPQAPPAPDPQTVLDLRRVLRAARPDVVHAHNWLVHSYLPLSRSGDRALALSLHDYGLRCATRRSLYAGAPCSGPGISKCARCASEHYAGVKGVGIAMATLAREPLLRRRVDVFLPVSEAVNRWCGLDHDPRSRVVPNFLPERRDRRQDHPLLGELPAEPYVLFLGDVTFDKGAQHLLEVYEGLPSPPPLVLIGRYDLDHRPSRANILTLGAWPHDAAQLALRRCLFVVVPAIWAEPFGLVALEAAAAGKAVVASDAGGLSGIVADGETGLLVPRGDRAALASALKRLIADEPLRGRLGEAATRRAARFTAEAIVPAFENAYGAAIEHRSTRSGRRSRVRDASARLRQ